MRRYHLPLILVLLLWSLTAVAACSGPSSGRQPESATTTLNPPSEGTLDGQVTIGPLVPVVREGVPEPTPAPEVYAERKIVIFSQDGKQELKRVDIDANGHYRVDLPAGTYVVDINHAGIDSAAGLPAAVVIRAGEATVLNIDIDTGIR